MIVPGRRSSASTRAAAGALIASSAIIVLIWSTLPCAALTCAAAPRLRARDLLAARPGGGLGEHRLGGLGARLGRRDLLGPRPGLELVEGSLRHRELGLGLLELRRPVAGLERHQHVAGLDPIALLDHDALDPAAGPRAE